jgi:REP element-mobilizing transposase RayT
MRLAYAPPGATDNSPAIYRWESSAIYTLSLVVTTEQGAVMPHSYISCLMHCIFSTRQRHKTISTDLQQRLWPFIGSIARENKMKALAIGGTEDHIHILLSLPATFPVAKAIQLIKGGSSKWIHEMFPSHRDFTWQERLRCIQC